MATLVMFSGGLDSTAVLVRLLTETKDDIRVHHIRMQNREGRADAEHAAVTSIVSWCRSNLRDFRFSQSGLDFSELEALPVDYVSVAYVACQVAIDTPKCNRIAVGTLSRDLDEIKRSVCKSQRQVFSGIYDCYRARKLGQADIEWIYPVYSLSKPQIASFLGPELLKMTWSCRRPVQSDSGLDPCGKCKPCLARIGISAALRESA